LSAEPAATPPLRELYCAANKVSVIEGLAALTGLTLLELGSNRVRNIEGLEVRGLLLCD
jgi:Leucine-rich repeat (LRR) protein